MKKRLSIADIAKSLGISVTAVSFILNGKAKERRISEALTKRVLDYVNKVGYKPSQQAKNKQAGRSKVIGLLVEDMSSSFFANMTEQLEKLAYESGYHLVYCNTNNDAKRAKALIQLFYDKQIDGFIIAPTEGLAEVIKHLQKNNVPVVLFDSSLDDLQTNFVVSDNRGGAYQGTRFLLDEKKASRVGFVTHSSGLSHMRASMEGYMQAIDEVGKDVLIKKISRTQPEEEIVLQIRDFMLDNRLDAVFFAANYLAIVGLKAIKQFDLSLDKLIAFDDHVLFPLVLPAVSAIAQNIPEIAGQLLAIMSAEMQGKSKGIIQGLVPCDIVAR